MDMEGAVVEQGKQQQHLPRALLAWSSFGVRIICTADGLFMNSPQQISSVNLSSCSQNPIYSVVTVMTCV